MYIHIHYTGVPTYSLITIPHLKKKHFIPRYTYEISLFLHRHPKVAAAVYKKAKLRDLQVAEAVDPGGSWWCCPWLIGRADPFKQMKRHQGLIV